MVQVLRSCPASGAPSFGRGRVKTTKTDELEQLLGNIGKKSMLVADESQEALESRSALRNQKILNRLDAIR